MSDYVVFSDFVFGSTSARSPTERRHERKWCTWRERGMRRVLIDGGKTLTDPSWNEGKQANGAKLPLRRTARSVYRTLVGRKSVLVITTSCPPCSTEISTRRSFFTPRGPRP